MKHGNDTSRTGDAPSAKPVQAIRRLAREAGHQLRPALAGFAVLTALTGGLFPLILLVLANSFFPRQAAGSLIGEHGLNVGSALIGQPFVRPEYLHSRPSAAGIGYDALSSGGTNYATSNPKLMQSVRHLVQVYRQENALSPTAPIPIDAVTSSGSGLDPEISLENAVAQIPRIARTRGLSAGVVSHLVAQNTIRPQLGFLGRPRVAVLAVNLQLDQLKAHQ